MISGLKWPQAGPGNVTDTNSCSWTKSFVERFLLVPDFTTSLLPPLQNQFYHLCPALHLKSCHSCFQETSFQLPSLSRAAKSHHGCFSLQIPKTTNGLHCSGFPKPGYSFISTACSGRWSCCESGCSGSPRCQRGWGGWGCSSRTRAWNRGLKHPG